MLVSDAFTLTGMALWRQGLAIPATVALENARKFMPEDLSKRRGSKIMKQKEIQEKLKGMELNQMAFDFQEDKAMASGLRSQTPQRHL